MRNIKLNVERKNKKRKKPTQPPDYKKYITQKNIENFIRDDTIIDWLEYYPTHHHYVKNLEKDKMSEFMSIRHQKYKNFIYDLFIKRYKNYNVKIIDNIKSLSTTHTHQEVNNLLYKQFIQTKIAIHSKCPIICNPLLINDNENKILEYDILVRGDFITRLIDKDIIPLDLRIDVFSESFSNKHLTYKYFIFKIFNNRLFYKKNTKYLRNSSKSVKIYKSQAIYSNLYVNTTLRDYINSRFIFCIPYKSNNEYIINEKNRDNIINNYTFNNFGIIDLEGNDNRLINVIKDANKWWKKLISNGNNWNVYPSLPSVEELYPNMKCKSIHWSNAKKDIACRIGEFTQLWGISLHNRKKLHQLGIKTLNDITDLSNFYKLISSKSNNTKSSNTKSSNIKSNKQFIIESMVKINKKDNNSSTLYL